MPRRDDHLAALCVPVDPDALLEIARNDGDALRSSYTEAGPRPGASRPPSSAARLVPVVSGSQSEDLEVVVLHGGQPVLAEVGAQLGYRFGGDSNVETRGWNPPNVLAGFTTAAWSALDTYDATACATARQQLVVAYRSDADRWVRVYDPASATWGDPVSVRSTGSPSDVVVRQGGRLLCLADGRAYRSDDDGATWSQHSAQVFGDDLPAARDDYTHPRAAAGDGSILYVANELGTDELVQLASDDGLATLRVVVYASGVGTQPSVVALPGGGYLLAFLRDADGFPVVRRLASAWERFLDREDVEVLDEACTELALSVDPDGLVWAHYVTAAAPGQVLVATSLDQGATWRALDEGALRSLSAGDAQIVEPSAVSCGGAVFLVGRCSTTSSALDGSVVVLELGGWTTHPAAPPGWANARDWTQRAGTGDDDGATWVAVEEPQHNGWTAAGAGIEQLESPRWLRIDTSSSTRTFERATDDSSRPAWCAAEFYVISGGDPDTAEVALRRWVSWSGHQYAIGVRASETALVAFDGYDGEELGRVEVDVTEPVQVLVLCRGEADADSGVWWKRPGETVWQPIPLAEEPRDDSGTPIGTGGLVWGHIASSTSASRWAWVADSDSASVGSGLGTTPALGRPASQFPVPLHLETGVAGEGPAWLAAVAGLAALGEVYEVPVAHDHPIERLVPERSPSPAERWRSTSTAEQIIAWDFGEETWLGDSLALVALECNFRRAHLESYDPEAGAWVTAGTLNLAQGRANVACDLVGDTLVPASGADNGYLAEGELRGGHAILEASGVARRIRWNTAGTLTGTGSTPRARILLEDVDGTEDLEEGVTLCSASGVLVVHLTEVLRRRRWRVRIGGGQAVADDFYAAGWLVPMAVRALGAPPDWGWSRERAPNVQVATSRRGTRRARRRGDLTEVWSFAWPSGVDLTDLRSGAPQSYVGASGGLPLTSAEDVPWLAGGLLELAKSGAVPVVALARLPPTGETLTDPSLFLPGHLTSSVRLDHVSGTEGATEFVRVAELVVERAL